MERGADTGDTVPRRGQHVVHGRLLQQGGGGGGGGENAV